MRRIRNLLLYAGGAVVALTAFIASILAWPSPLFAFSLGNGKVVVASDKPLPVDGATQFINACEALLARSPLKATGQHYRVYIANADWRTTLVFVANPDAGGIAYQALGRHVFLSGANFETGELVKRGYHIKAPRTLAYYCAHELTHIVIAEHIGMTGLFHLPTWVGEGLPDYVGIEERQSFEQLRAAIGDHSADLPMMRAYGVYAPYRLLVTYFLEKRGWSVGDLLKTRLTFDQAKSLMRNAGDL